MGKRAFFNSAKNKKGLDIKMHVYKFLKFKKICINFHVAGKTFPAPFLTLRVSNDNYKLILILLSDTLKPF